MEKSKWSDYARYLTLADNSNCQLKGSYEAFVNFKKVVEVLRRISNTDKSSYLYEGDIYSRKITSNDARIILDNVNDCKWTESTKKIFIVSSQMKMII